MAEAHSAVAFSFTVDDEGVNVRLNHEALHAVWQSGVRSWKKRLGRIKNQFHNGVYPASPASWLFTLTIVLAFYMAAIDPSFGFISFLQAHVPGMEAIGAPKSEYIGCLIYSVVLWFTFILLFKYTLKALLTYTGWMHEPRGKVSIITKAWLLLVKLLEGPKPRLYSYQGSLPKLPVPSLAQTMKQYLRSVRPLCDDEKYQRMENLVQEFKSGIGRKLQWYLVLKSWWATNYVSDWWEEYVYLRGRSPIMVNSNFYGVDAVLRHATTNQAARAANIIYAMLQFRRLIDREDLGPIMLNKTVPLCSWQYERQFNTSRVPGVETDTLKHVMDSKHIAVYHKGRYFKVYIYTKGRLLAPCEIEVMLQKILDNQDEPAAGEKHLAALTAGDRIPWARARADYFAKGVNKASLDAIEKAAFVVALDEDEQNFDRDDPNLLDAFGRSMLHGKGYDRWFDKSFTLVVCSNGRIGFNAEHSWADAPCMAHCWEHCMFLDDAYGYRDDGHTKGEVTTQPPNPIKLQWELPEACQAAISNSLAVAQDLINDVDLHLLMHDAYGKGFMKKCKVSPDAFIQMALQLAYYRDAGKFCLTYEASMTRLYREGRTETVRSCSVESSAFARAMENKSVSKAECIKLMRKATERHQDGYRAAMTGGGIDRHLFCLYVVSKYLGIESPFLKEVLSEPWRLSTSQTPHQQTDKLDLTKNPDLISAGGGFGPVADDGYGVSYIVAGEDMIFFHISSKRSCAETDSKRFGRTIQRSLQDLHELFSP
ncbi:hypothetical protein CAPTEDRAFT_178036 [Capitella teleta]|uniref:carnitine O-palmitoyltransferase n=1 Tax=Capitella teleta TaxID=283909 RepID=R7T4M2_CAPTE|nr:hypothetical protein CAPTEDRAFT_178036 [Capitella teleta]|eukprot:ELT88002.1 hypothetical protein CAPTEDRAFT_178036 [Capitella teleta]